MRSVPFSAAEAGTQGSGAHSRAADAGHKHPVTPNLAQVSHMTTSSPIPASLSHRTNPEPEPDAAITLPPASITEAPAKTLTAGTGSVTSTNP